MNGDSIMKTWPCRESGCSSKADGVGSPAWLLAGGWDVELKPDGDPLVFCPTHHRSGIEIAQEVARTFKFAMLGEIREAEGEQAHG
jgi:hypothetical protein